MTAVEYPSPPITDRLDRIEDALWGAAHVLTSTTSLAEEIEDLLGLPEQFARRFAEDALTLTEARRIALAEDLPSWAVDGCVCGNPDLPTFDHAGACPRRGLPERVADRVRRSS